MRKLVIAIVVMVLCIIAFTLVSCRDESVISYGDDQFSLKESPDFAKFQNLDLKEEGFAKVTGGAEVPPFPIDGPDTIVLYPVSDTGYVSTSPFYLHQLPQTTNAEGGGTRQAQAWWKPDTAGIYQVTITVTNTRGQFDAETITITVFESTNTPPIIFAKYAMRKK